MTILLAIAAVAICLSSTMAAAWWLALRTGRSGWIDAAWSFAVGISGAALAVWPTTGTESGLRQALVALMALGWSLRLGIHISLRTANGGDDPRYRHLREEWGDSFRIRLFWFLQIQALAALALALTIMIAARNPSPGLGIGDGIGVAILALAILGEGLADSQLSNFRSKPENREKVCDVGLWSLSRHPNYFFEWLAWLAYPFIAIDPAGGYPLGWLALAAPMLMYRLLVHVSGVPPLEAHMLRSRGAAFRDYQQRVNAFWPGWPTTAGRGVYRGGRR